MTKFMPFLGFSAQRTPNKIQKDDEKGVYYIVT